MLVYCTRIILEKYTSARGSSVHFASLTGAGAQHKADSWTPVVALVLITCLSAMRRLPRSLPLVLQGNLPPQMMHTVS